MLRKQALSPRAWQQNEGDDKTVSNCQLVDYSLQRGNDTLTMKKINDPSQNHQGWSKHTPGGKSKASYPTPNLGSSKLSVLWEK